MNTRIHSIIATGIATGVLALFVPGCSGGGGGEAPPASLVLLEDITDTSVCPGGGTFVRVGRDDNGNGLLDTSEVEAWYPVCNGADGIDGTSGTNALVATTSLGVGDANCPGGGTRIETGLDTNGSGVLDPGEVTSTSYTCGAIAPDTRVITNDSGSWMIEDEATRCPSGGTEVIAYIDLDSDGVYDPGTDTLLSSNGVCFGQDTLVQTTTLPLGDPQCPNGGVQIDAGQDSNGNGVLDPAEVRSTSYACTISSQVISNGSGAWVVLDEAASCPYGGAEIISYVDVDASNDYSPADILLGADFTCNGAPGAPGDPGAPGLNTLVAVTTFTGSQNGCSAGGTQIDFGLDLDADGVLDPGEVTQTYYTCDGASGINEGSLVAPIAVAMNGTPHLATVGAGGASYYRFATVNTGGRDAPYTARVNAQESVLDIDFYSDAFVTPLAITCTVDAWSGNQWCQTARLTSGADVYMSATELYMVPNQFFTGLEFSASEGSEAAPVDLGSLVGGNLTATLASHPAGQSYYSFTAPTGGVHTLQLSNYFGDPNVPQASPDNVSVHVVDSMGNFITSCYGMASPCLVGLPSAGTYGLVALSYDAGAIYDVAIAQGAAFLPALTLNSYPGDLPAPTSTNVPMDSTGMGQGLWYRVTTNASGELTILHTGDLGEPRYWNLLDGTLSSVFDCWTGICSVTGLAPATEYYLVTNPSIYNNTILTAYDRSFGVDQTITLDGAGNYTALMTTDSPSNNTFLHFDSGPYGGFDLVVDNASFPPWSAQFMEVMVMDGGVPINSCFFDGFGGNYCSFPLAPFRNYTLEFLHWDGAIQFDMMLQGN